MRLNFLTRITQFVPTLYNIPPTIALENNFLIILYFIFMILSRIRLVSVSGDVLASVPWVGTSRLVSIMDQVVQRGPNDQKTWNILTRRADLIMDSFSSNNLSRMVVILTKSPLSDLNFKEKLKKQSLKMVQDSDLLSCCGFLFGFSKMGLCDSDIAVKFRERIISELSSAKNSYPLVLILSVYSKNKDEKMVKLLLKELLEHMETMTPKSFSMVISDVLTNFNTEEIFLTLDPFIISSLKCMNSMDLRSLVQLYSVFSTTNHPLRGEYLQNLARNMSKLVIHASLHQLSVILRGYSKSLVDTELLQMVLSALKLKYNSGELQELLFILSHLLKLNLTDLDLTRNLLCKIVKFNNFNPLQFSNLAYLCGKFGIQISQEFVIQNFQNLKNDFSTRDLALFTCGICKLGILSLFPEVKEMANNALKQPETLNTQSYHILSTVLRHTN
ncbi:putative integral membrane protein [Theileria parva strain Muguga]|uniref:putative integral membrane protein n=1 Tax=Theileria parva strain Muguga TaxID=333668 RepID=UPI001C621CE4|nr:putative integral membrane protein [Theileria parva strain Muguga]KAF5153657.1 putative integral membrane protein [Theileria parva strain Muguga]